MQGLQLGGSRALVTGGAGGLGRHICRDLADLGADVLVADIDAGGAREVAADLPRAEAFAVDLRDPSSIGELVAGARQGGDVDIMISNAGWDKVGPFVDSSPDIWDALLAVNLRAPIQLAHAFLPRMLEREAGRLIFVSSDAGRVGSSGEAVYSACKAGLIGLAKTLARESARRGVTSNAVCPGPDGHADAAGRGR